MLIKRILWLLLTALITVSAHAQNANKVVVIPMAGDSSLQGSTITIVDSKNVAAGSFSCLIVNCPSSHPLAIGGGVDPFNVFHMHLTSSTPLVNGARALNRIDGTYNDASDGWQGCARNNGAGDNIMKVAVICTK